MLRNARDSKKSSAITTGADGRFAFQAPAGMYQLIGERHGQGKQSYGQRALYASFSSAVVVGPDQDTGSLVFRLISNAALSGKVVDEAGEPVENALVQIFESYVVGGHKQVSERNWAYTNDLGEYRFAWLAAGTYYAAVSATPWYAAAWNPSSVSATPLTSPTGMSFAPVFYPNAREASKAGAIRIQPGDEAVANFSLNPLPASRLDVHCEGCAVGRNRLWLYGEGFPGAEFSERILDMWGPHLNIPSVPPGHYRVRVVSIGTEPAMAASQNIDVGGSDVQVKLMLHEVPTVQGALKVNEDIAGVAAQLIIMLRDGETGRGVSRGVAADGSFGFPGMTAGKYQALIYQPGEYWVRQVFADGVEAKGGVIEITDDHAPRLVIVAAKGVAHLQGKVLRDGKPFMGAQVVLTPPDKLGDLNDSYGDQSNSDGSFEVKNVHPGDYLLLAFEDPEVEYANPAVLRPYLKQAKRVHVEAGGAYTEEVNVQ